jgi:hypothetical protein
MFSFLNELEQFNNISQQQQKKDIIISEKESLKKKHEQDIENYSQKIIEFTELAEDAQLEFEEYADIISELEQEQMNMITGRSNAIKDLEFELEETTEKQQKSISDLESSKSDLEIKQKELTNRLISTCKVDKEHTNKTKDIKDNISETSKKKTSNHTEKDKLEEIIKLNKEASSAKKQKHYEDETDEKRNITSKYDDKRKIEDENLILLNETPKSSLDNINNEITRFEEQINELNKQINLLNNDRFETCKSEDELIKNPEYKKLLEDIQNEIEKLVEANKKLNDNKDEIETDKQKLINDRNSKNQEYEDQLSKNKLELDIWKSKKDNFLIKVGEFDLLIKDMGLKLNGLDAEIIKYEQLKLNVSALERMWKDGFPITDATMLWEFILSTFSTDEIKAWNLPDIDNLDWTKLLGALNIVKDIELNNLKNLMKIRNRLKKLLSTSKDINISKLLAPKINIPKPKTKLGLKDDKAKVAFEFEFRWSEFFIGLFTLLIIIVLFLKFIVSE